MNLNFFYCKRIIFHYIIYYFQVMTGLFQINIIFELFNNNTQAGNCRYQLVGQPSSAKGSTVVQSKGVDARCNLSACHL